MLCSTLFDPLEFGPGISIRNSCQNFSNVALRSCSKDIWLTSARARAMAALDHQNGRPGYRQKHLRKWRLQPAHRFLVPWPFSFKTLQDFKKRCLQNSWAFQPTCMTSVASCPPYPPSFSLSSGSSIKSEPKSGHSDIPLKFHEISSTFHWNLVLIHQS